MPITVTYRCSQCGDSCLHSVNAATQLLCCPHCQHQLRPADSAFVAGRLRKCLVCPSTELFVRKNFPQRLGVTIVVLGFAASSVAWFYHMLITTFAILFATALIDVVLYLSLGELVECYRCHAQYRGLPDLTAHEPFDLEIHERHRQVQARLALSATVASEEQPS